MAGDAQIEVKDDNARIRSQQALAPSERFSISLLAFNNPLPRRQKQEVIIIGHTGTNRAAILAEQHSRRMSDRSSDNDSVVETYEEENELEKRTRNRERNKEHARKTRLRKKELIDGLKARVRELEEEGRVLKQQVEACNVASILIGLSTGEGDAATSEVASASVASIPSQPSFTEALSGGKRKRFLSIDGEETSPPPMELNIKGHIVSVGGSGKNGKMQMNWKTGTYFDEHGKMQRLTESELKALRLVFT